MALTKVFVLTNELSPNAIAFNYPLFVNRRRLAKRGVDLSFSTRLCDPPSDTDVLFINSKVLREMWGDGGKKVSEILLGWRKIVKKIAWFDTTDSTGTPQFYLLPYLDFYGKAQLLKDKTLYNNKFLGGRIYTDFYAREFGIESDYAKIKHVVVPLEELAKVNTSWHSGVADYTFWAYYLNRLRRHLPIPYKYWSKKMSPPEKERKISVTCRVSTNYTHAAISFHRKKTVELLAKYQVPQGKVSRRQYFQELQNCKVSVSPFGFGEINLRDCEIIMSGATLFKPDMSHLETFPDLFVPDETYVPFKWDFSDFEEKLEELLNDEEKRIEIARNAQARYRRLVLQEEGQTLFCDKIMKIVEH